MTLVTPLDKRNEATCDRSGRYFTTIFMIVPLLRLVQ